MKNLKFEKYYRTNLNLSTDEFNILIKTLLKPLPCVLRFNNNNKLVEKSKLKLSNLTRKLGVNLKFRQILDDTINLIYEIDLSREILKSDQKFKELHNYIEELVLHNIISRQELVSIVPPLLLNVVKNDKIIDLCAAPGSKTKQIIEYIDGNALVIANDINPKRCELLNYNLKLTKSPYYIITRQKAEEFPLSLKSEIENYLFDKVLCDVPCSGDGVIRKHPEQLTNWNFTNGIKMHKIQLKILSRGAKLLKENGTLIYSTCSMNPTENEAVIANFLRQENTENSEYRYLVENCENKFSKNFKIRKGLLYWNFENINYDNLEIQTTLKNNRDRSIYSNSSLDNAQFLCPEKYYDIVNSFDNDLKEKLLMEKGQIEDNIKNAIRILPHDNDTSGFFIAKIKKYRIKSYSKKKYFPNYISPYNNNLMLIESIIDNKAINFLKLYLKSFYKISDNFNFKNIAVKNSDANKLYYVSDEVSNIMSKRNLKINIYSSGVRIFEKTNFKIRDADLNLHSNFLNNSFTDNKCVKLNHYKICTEGIEVISNYISLKDGRAVITKNKLFINNLLSKGKINLSEDLHNINNLKLSLDLKNLKDGGFIIYIIKEYVTESEVSNENIIDYSDFYFSCIKISQYVYIHHNNSDKVTI